jgi:hypothetical protein
MTQVLGCSYYQGIEIANRGNPVVPKNSKLF